MVKVFIAMVKMEANGGDALLPCRIAPVDR
jgi:hypothetical protein